MAFLKKFSLRIVRLWFFLLPPFLLPGKHIEQRRFKRVIGIARFAFKYLRPISTSKNPCGSLSLSNTGNRGTYAI